MINIALLGFGRIGQMHAENINKNKDLKLLYVYEKINVLSKKAKKLYNCKIEKDYNKIFNDKNVDIIFISTPTNTHLEFIKKSMTHKKTIFCEKPLDLNIKKILKKFKKVKKINPKIQLGFNRRYDPGHYSIKKDLEKNKIGKLEKISADLVIYNAGIDVHEDDILGHLNLSDFGIIEREKMVLDFIVKRKLPFVVTLGGGYQKNVATLGNLHSMIFREVLNRL